MHIEAATSQHAWDHFLLTQPFRPFLQSWTMGEVFSDIGEKPLRLVAKEGDAISGICQAIVVPAKRGRHLAVHYGPVVQNLDALQLMIAALSDLAREHRCSFIRMSPFVLEADEVTWKSQAGMKIMPSPLHLLGEHIWYLPLVKDDPWMPQAGRPAPNINVLRSEEDILMQMRKTTRNLIRRAEKDGVTVRASDNPVRDLPIFLKLHNETKARHRFTPYRESFFRAQVAHFAPRKECTLYIAEHQGQVLATSIHMHIGGETSYHHGASTPSKIPASYLLQWRAIQDAVKRGDHVYSFWGIAPVRSDPLEVGSWKLEAPKHPFAGMTLFKTGFGGNLLNLMHCVDIPLQSSYHLTRAFEFVRKWRRGF